MKGTGADCDRWEEIADRCMLGDEISEADARFAREHLEGCAFCRAESSAWAAIAESEKAQTLPDDDARAMVDRALGAARDRTATDKKLPLREELSVSDKKLPLREELSVSDKKLPLREEQSVSDKKLPLRTPMPSYAPSAGHSVISLDQARKNRGAYMAGAVAAALALAAGTALLLRSRSAEEAAPVATLVSSSGSVTIAGKTAAIGARVAAGGRLEVGPASSACLVLGEGAVRTCLDEQSEITLEKTSPEDRRIFLARGTIVTALDKLPAGHRFTVDAQAGRAVVTGTVFSVSTSADHQSIVVRVHEGSVRAEANDRPPRAVGASEELDVRSQRTTSVDKATRDHELTLVGVAVPGDEPVAAPPSASVASAPASSVASAPEVVAKPPGPGELLEAARKLRTQGQASAAAEAYRRLMAIHPKSAEAHAALLSLAELQLGPLGDPSGALRSYDAYLRSGGGLSQEARYGRIQALRRLGRAAEERAAIDEFLKAYPNSVQARALKARLGEGDAAKAP